MNDTSLEMLEMLAMLALTSYLCAPGIRALLGPEIQRAWQSALLLAARLAARREGEDHFATSDAAANDSVTGNDPQHDSRQPSRSSPPRS